MINCLSRDMLGYFALLFLALLYSCAETVNYLPWNTNELPIVSIQVGLGPESPGNPHRKEKWVHLCSGITLLREKSYALIGVSTQCIANLDANAAYALQVTTGFDGTPRSHLGIDSIFKNNAFTRNKGEGGLAILKVRNWAKRQPLYLEPLKNLHATSQMLLAPYLSNCSIVGWDHNSHVTSPGHGGYKEKRVAVLPESSCFEEWGEIASIDSKICITRVGDDDIPCPLDPGGILFCYDALNSTNRYLLGMSAGIGPDFCGQPRSVSGLYHNILQQVQFLHYTVTNVKRGFDPGNPEGRKSSSRDKKKFIIWRGEQSDKD